MTPFEWFCAYLGIGFIFGLCGLAITGQDFDDDMWETVGYMVMSTFFWPLMAILAIIYKVTGEDAPKDS